MQQHPRSIIQHASWTHTPKRNTNDAIIQTLMSHQHKARAALMDAKSAPGVVDVQGQCVPCISAERLYNDTHVQKCAYDLFYNQVGCVIVKGVFSTQTMNEVNQWTRSMIQNEARYDTNCTHAKQKDKLLVNDVMTRMADTSPNLLLDTVLSNRLTSILDTFLGFARIGSATMHWIQPGGDRQQSHVDYPIHVGSGAFWEGRVSKVMETMTRYQINHVMPYYSVQALVATDCMDAKNGSTEVVPCSHLLPDMDIIVHRSDTRAALESHFINVRLEQGDVLVFNRRLCHRGGRNMSQFKRNALIIQAVFLWGIGQEIIEDEKILLRLESKSRTFRQFTRENKDRIAMRLRAPYPVDVKQTA